MTCNHVICLVLFVLSPCITLVPKPECKQDMATGGGLAQPEPLVDNEARSWFKRYEVCTSENGWNDQKKLLQPVRLPTLLKGCSWAIYDLLQDEETDTYDHLKVAILKRLSPDTKEDRIVARECLSRRVLHKEESID